MQISAMKNKNTLILGDTIAIAILTFIGFATHGEADISFLPRMAAAFFPVLVSWFLFAPWFGLFDEHVITDPKSLWRLLPAMFAVAPLAVILRAAILNSAGLPIFTLVLGGTNALGMLAWRALYLFAIKRNTR
jgi:hypothetical protein